MAKAGALRNETIDETFTLTTSRHFPQWLAATGCGIAFTTYQTGKLITLGVSPSGELSAFQGCFSRPTGLAVGANGRSIVLATEHMIQRFDNIVPAGEIGPDGFDAVFAPHSGWVTGDLDVHDIGYGADGNPVFANTLFSCLATVGDGHGYRFVWKPSFISRLAAEDRCHLNGLVMEDGRARYVTAVSRSDTAEGWRNDRREGGVVIDVESDEIVAGGLSMPHSPRLYDGRLWLLNSGTGDLGFVEPQNGRFEAVAFCPGYARGLAFAGGQAVIGLSLWPEGRTFSGLALNEALVLRDVEPRCGLAVVDLASGELAHWARIEGSIRVLYDVVALPGARHPSAIGFKTSEICPAISNEG